MCILRRSDALAMPTARLLLTSALPRSEWPNCGSWTTVLLPDHLSLSCMLHGETVKCGLRPSLAVLLCQSHALGFGPSEEPCLGGSWTSETCTWLRGLARLAILGLGQFLASQCNKPSDKFIIDGQFSCLLRLRRLLVELTSIEGCILHSEFTVTTLNSEISKIKITELFE